MWIQWRYTKADWPDRFEGIRSWKLKTQTLTNKNVKNNNKHEKEKDLCRNDIVSF